MKNAKRIFSGFMACSLVFTLVNTNAALAETVTPPLFSLSAQQNTLTPGSSTRLILDQSGTEAIQSVAYTYDDKKVIIDEALGTLSINGDYELTKKETVQITAEITYYNSDDVLFSDSFEGEKTFIDDPKDGNSKREASYAHSGLVSHWGEQAATPVASVKGPARKAISDADDQYGTVLAWFYDSGDTTTGKTAETKFAFETNAGAATFHGVGVAYDSTTSFTDNHAAYYSKRGGAFNKTGKNWDVTNVARTKGWHQLRWNVTAEGTKAYIDGELVIDSTDVKSIKYLQFLTNWNSNSPQNIADKLFIDDVTVVKPGADENVNTETVTLDVVLKPIIDYTQTGPAEVTYNKTSPSEIKTTIAPATDLDGLVVKLNDQPLTLGADYTLSEGDIVVDEEYLAALSLGSHIFTLTIDSFQFSLTVTVIDTADVRDYYFSNIVGSDETGDGSIEKPWKSLDKLNALDLNPGDTVYLDAKSIWVGQIFITDSGSAGMPITITKYNDEGNRNARPIIDAGPVVTAETAKTCTILEFSQGSNPAAGALEIRSASYVTVRGLELTNDGGETDKNRIKGRNGILVIADLPENTTDDTYNKNWDASYQSNIHINDCYVHDVNSNPSFKMAGGINFFGNIDDILVENCKVIDCDVEGIRNAGLYNKNNNWPAVHTVTFRNNYISGSAGDGMVISNVLDSTISYNVITNCGDASLTTANYANLWLIGAKNTVVEYNEVFNNNHDRCNDGEAFDFDYNCEDSIYQYNYTHHNAGGVILFMGTPKNNIFRYNISVEDGSTANRPHLFFYAGAGNTDTAPYIYNNVFMVGEGVKTLFDDGGSKGVFFYNNILMSVNGNVPQFTNASFTSGFIKNNIIYPKSLLNSGLDGGVTVADNYFVNPQLAGPGEAPENVMAGAMTAEAHFDLSKLAGYKLLTDSPAINKGTVVTLPRNIDRDRPVTRDFFGNPLSGNPDIGVHEWSNDSPEQTVFEVLLTGIAIEADKTTLEIGDTTRLTALPTPYNAWDSGVEWTSSNNAVVTVDLTGRVTATGAGTATITGTALADSNITDTVEFTVRALPELDHFKVQTEHNYILDSEGGKIQLSVVGVDQYGNDYFVAPADIKSVVYTASAGTVDDGMLTVPQGTTGDVTVSAKVTMQNYDYYESFEMGSTLTGGTVALVRTMDRAYEGDWSMKTMNNGSTDDDAIKAFDAPRQGTVTIMFYDTAGKSARKAISVSPNDTLYAIGVRTDETLKDYYYHRIDGTSNWTVSDVQRSTGWHEFKWAFSDAGLSIYIDGKLQASNSKITNYKMIDILSRKGWSEGDHNGNFGVDAIKAWTEASGTTNHDTANVTLTANPIGASEIYVTAPADAITTNYGTLQMSAQFLPMGEGDVIWSVIPIDGKAEISETGLLTAMSNGRVRVRATAKDGSGLSGEKIIQITGSLIHAEAIQVTLVSGENPPTHDKEATQMVARFTPSNTGDKSVTWSISAPDGGETDLATIDQSGVMHSWKNGTVRVTATSKETPSVSGYLDITISGQWTRVESVTVNGPASLTVGESYTLTASVSPEDAAEKSVLWSISNNGSTEAAIDPETGVFTAGSIPGTVTVTAAAQDGGSITGTLQITINSSYFPSPSRPKPTENPNIDVTATEGGKVDSKLNANGSTTYTFKPEKDKEVLYVRVNGLLVKADSVTIPKGETASIVTIFGENGTDHSKDYTDTAALPEYMTEAVNYVVGSGLFQGNGESFVPMGNMNRAMFATVLARLYGADTTKLTSDFADVAQGSWYEGSVAWISDMGITSGVGGGNFAPEADMTRQELVTLVYRFAQKVGADVSATGVLTAFPDGGSVNAWSTEAMSWAVGLGMITGKDGSLAPNDTITRVEAAIILQRMADLLVKA